jgi:hypothetical protein
MDRLDAQQLQHPYNATKSNPMPLSLQQAATATGKQKSTISRAIKSGRVSATITESGTYQIDPAELFRVFPPKPVPDDCTPSMQQKVPGQNGGATDETASENMALRVRVDLLGKLVGQIEEERDHLRRQLDDEKAERREAQAKLTALLTHQPTKQSEPQARSHWKKAVLAILLCLVAAFTWNTVTKETPPPTKAPAVQAPSQDNRERWQPDDNGS